MSPRMIRTALVSGMSWVTSLQSPPVVIVASGMLYPSTMMWCLLPVCDVPLASEAAMID